VICRLPATEPGGPTPGGDKLEIHRRFEDFHGLADDPDAVQLAGAELELDVDAAGAVHMVTLRTRELRDGAGMRQQSLLGEVRA